MTEALDDKYHRLRQLEADAEHNRDELRARADRADDVARAARSAIQSVRREAWGERVELTTRNVKSRKMGRLVPLEGIQTPEPSECGHCGEEVQPGLSHCPECSTELDGGGTSA